MKFKLLLERWIILWAVLAMAFTALVYPLDLQESYFTAIQNWFGKHGPAWSAFFERDLRPLLNFGYHPLVLKETLGALCAFLMFIGYWAWKVFYAPKRKEPLGLHYPLLLLMALGGVSLIWTPSFSISLKTLQAFIPAAFFLLMVSDMDWRQGGRRKLLTALAIVGAILTVVGLLQILPRASTFYYKFFHRFDNPRNSLPGWIGHNTEMSSYVLSGMLASTALLLTTKRRLARVLLVAHLVAAAVVIIAGQSRAIWPLAILLLGWLAVAGRREMARKIRPWQVISVLAVLIVLCIPFAGKLKERIKHYGPQAVLVETRTRILFASQSLIREKPFLGHGIGSFASVYPKAQGDFFASHPDSPFAATDLRTPQAHNDYLQLVVEMGIVGLALGMIGLLLYIRYGAQGMKSLAEPSDRILALAFGLIAVQHLLNAIVNFPLHVPPAAYLLALSMGVWVSLGRESTPQPVQEGAKIPANAALRVAVLLLALMPIGLAPLFVSLVARELVASTHFMMGIYHLNQLSNPNAKGNPLLETERHMLAAKKLDPLDWESHYYLAVIDLESGKSLSRQYRAAATSPDPRQQAQAPQLRAKAGLFFQQGIQKLKPPFAEVQFHQTFHLLAQIYQELDRIYPGQYGDKIRENLELAVRYSPVYYEGLQALFKFYSTDKYLNPVRQLQLARKMYEVDPNKLYSEMAEPALKEFNENDFLLAAQKYNFVNLVVKPMADPLFLEMSSWLYAGRMDRAIEALGRLEQFSGRGQAYWQGLMLIQLAQGQDQEALRLALQHGAQQDPPDPIATAIAALVFEGQGESEKAIGLWKNAFKTLQEDFRYTCFRAQLSQALGKYPKVVENDLREMLKYKGAAAAIYHMQAKLEFDRGNFQQALNDATEAVRRGYGGSQANLELIRLSREKLASGGPSTTPATTPATTASRR